MVRALLLPDYYLVTVMLSGIKVSLGGFLGGPYGFRGGAYRSLKVRDAPWDGLVSSRPLRFLGLVHKGVSLGGIWGW